MPMNTSENAVITEVFHLVMFALANKPHLS